MSSQLNSCKSHGSHQRWSSLVTFLLVLLVAQPSSSFVVPTTTTPSKPSSSSSSLDMFTLSDVSDFYATYPVQSAVLTCGFKASIADGIAQLRADPERRLQLRRNLAYVLYGGIFVGLMCHLEYDCVFPMLFGGTSGHVVEKVLVDDFISAPLLWLPPAYLIKAWVYEYPLKEGLQKYVQDIRSNGLLWKYWTIWVPAQSISFSVVPDHLRVAFMASISFFWFILFSTVSSKNDGDTLEKSTTTTTTTNTVTTST